MTLKGWNAELDKSSSTNKRRHGNQTSDMYLGWAARLRQEDKITAP